MDLLHAPSLQAKKRQCFGDGISLRLPMQRGEEEPILVGPKKEVVFIIDSVIERASLHYWFRNGD
jgi:hypothetical protein